jgi:integrase/recombinase XerC
MEDNKNNFLKYLKYELNYSDLTIKGYEYEIDKFQEFLKCNNIDYKNLNNDIIRNYLKYLDGFKYNKNSLSRNLSALRSYYKFLVANKVVLNNPFKTISNPKKDKKLPNFLNYEEIDKIFSSIDISTPLGLRNRCIVEILYDTGLRVSELINLKINNIDFNDKTIVVYGKGKKQRIVYFGEYLDEVLNQYLTTARKELLNNKNSDYLILNKDGNKITTRGVEFIIDQIVSNASIKHKISPHVLRHTFATHMLNGGSDIKTIQQLLGHESLSTTGIYTHITNDVLRTEYLKSHPRSKTN